LLSEMALTAQDLVVIGRGRLIAQATTQEFIERAGSAGIRVRSPQLDKLSALLNQSGAVVRPTGGEAPETAEKAALVVSGMESAAIGELAAANGVVLHELSRQAASLEEAFMRLTGDSVDYRTQSTAGTA
jgi:ABC-2 type transport system ATP-binding protein